jgi:[ribosomal protein S18]-alanine N-acetyltransferase
MASLASQDPFSRQNMSFLLQPLPESLLIEAIALDQQVLGGFWNLQSYQEELHRLSSDLLGLSPAPPLTDQYPPLLAVGCTWTILDEAHIILMTVHPQYRRRGFGYGMLLKLLEAACSRGMKYATLEVRASNVAAIALYTKLGFTAAGTRRNYYTDNGSDNGEDALVMWRSGLQSPEFAAQIIHHWAIVAQHWQKDEGSKGEILR